MKVYKVQMILQKTQTILVEVWCRCIIIQKNDFVLVNPLGQWLQEQYWKHQPIKPIIDQMIKTNQINNWEQLFDKVKNSCK